MKTEIIACDFDGTLCENKYPDIGEERTAVIDFIKARQQRGSKIILWTCRIDNLLRDAINWCNDRGLFFDAVNENLPEVVESFGTESRKIFADVYIDDRMVLPPIKDASIKNNIRIRYTTIDNTFTMYAASYNINEHDGYIRFECVEEHNEDAEMYIERGCGFIFFEKIISFTIGYMNMS